MACPLLALLLTQPALALSAPFLRAIASVDSPGLRSIPAFASALPAAISSGDLPDSSALWSAGHVSLRPLEAYGQSAANDSVNVTRTSVADLALGMSASTNFIHVEQNLVFILAITNNGPDTASGVLVNNRLPASATLLSVQASQGTFSRAADRVVFNLGDLSAGSRATAAITLKFSAAGAATNIAQVGTVPVDLAPSNRSCSLVLFATNALPTVSPITDRATTVNTPTPQIPFIVSDAETPAANLLLLGSSSNTKLVPDENLVFGGAGGNRTLILVPAPNQIGAAVITVTAVDPDGGETSASFALTVLPASIEALRIERIDRVSQPANIDRVERSEDLFKLYFNVEPGWSCTVDYCDSLLAGAWQTLTNINAMPAPALVEVSDPIVGRPQRFYRLSTQPPVQPAEIRAAPALINLSFTAQPGVSYTIEYTDSLTPASWHTLTNLSPASVESTITVSLEDNNQPQRFYRLRLP